MQALQLHWFWIPRPTGSALQKWPSRAISYRHSTINNSVWYVKYILLLRFSVIFNILRLYIRRLSKDLSQHPPLKFSRVSLALQWSVPKINFLINWFLNRYFIECERDLWNQIYFTSPWNSWEKSLNGGLCIFDSPFFNGTFAVKLRMSTSMEREFVLACPALIWN